MMREKERNRGERKKNPEIRVEMTGDLKDDIRGKHATK
jgi:hypothetical protein